MPIKKKVTQIVEDNNIDKKLKKEKDNSEKESNKGYKHCPYCDKEIKEQAIKCQYCKNFLNKAKKECPFCFNEIDADSLKCPFCDEFLEFSDDVDEATKNYASLSGLCRDVKENVEEDEEENEEKKYVKKYVCDSCKGYVEESAEICPHCGATFNGDDNEDEYTIRDGFATILIIFMLIAAGGAIISFISN